MRLDKILVRIRALAILTLVFSLPCLAHECEDYGASKESRSQRRCEAFKVKTEVAEFNKKKKIGRQETNGDEARYHDLRGSFGKSLKHRENQLIDRKSFESLLRALCTHKNSDFNKIILGSEPFHQDNKRFYL